jgi:Uncharacterised BCR, YnfA/UPF0060 family
MFNPIFIQTLRSLMYFLLAGVCEIGGGYLIWLWLREGKSPWLGLAGAVVIMYVWRNSHPPACQFWARLCGLRWSVHSAGHAVGMAH